MQNKWGFWTKKMMSAKTTVYNGKLYELKGQCNMCGKCCLGEFCYNVDIEAGELVDMYLKNPKLDGLCEYLDEHKKLCTINDRKPLLCELYPKLYQELIKDCGYRWEYVCDCEGVPNTDYNWDEIRKDRERF